MNGLTLLALIVVLAGGFLLYRAGFMRGRKDGRGSATSSLRAAVAIAQSSDDLVAAPIEAVAAQVDAGTPITHAISDPGSAGSALPDEYARLVGVLAVENFALRDSAVTADAGTAQLLEFAEDRRRLLRELADARGDTARYRQLVIDLENDAPPPLLTGRNAIDDLKLVVGIGPVLERMLQQLGIATYRQIARWSERDIDEFDAKLSEFPGRIRRDEWVKQARALHHSKYGEQLDPRG